jgi:hypothetical protein
LEKFLNLKALNVIRKNFSEAQIVSILQMQESGRSVKEICREHGISNGGAFNTTSKIKTASITIKIDCAVH